MTTPFHATTQTASYTNTRSANSHLKKSEEKKFS